MNNQGAKRARDDDSSDDIKFSDSSDEEGAQAVVRRVRTRTIGVEVRFLEEDSFKVLNNAKPSVGEAKAEVARLQGVQVVQEEEEKEETAEG